MQRKINKVKEVVNLIIKINKKNLISLLLAFFSVIGMVNLIKVPNINRTFSNSILSIVLFVGLFLLFSYVIKFSYSKRLILVTTVLGTFFSFWMNIGKNILIYNNSFLNQKIVWLSIFLCIPFFSATLIIIFDKFFLFINRIEVSDWAKNLLNKLFNLKYKLYIYWLIIFLAWIPTLLATFPGINGYDSAAEYSYYLTGNITTHQPIVHTYLLEFLIQTVGGGWLHSEAAGLLIYSLIQMLILSFAMAWVVHFLNVHNVPNVLNFCVLFIFSFLPVNPIMAISSTKDIIFSATVVGLQLMLVNLIENIENEISISFFLKFFVIVFMNLVFRSQSIYVYIFTALLTMIILWKNAKKLIILLFSPILAFMLFTGPFSRSLHVVKFDSLHEMMSVPCVQLSRVLVEDREN